MRLSCFTHDAGLTLYDMQIMPARCPWSVEGRRTVAWNRDARGLMDEFVSQHILCTVVEEISIFTLYSECQVVLKRTFHQCIAIIGSGKDQALAIGANTLPPTSTPWPISGGPHAKAPGNYSGEMPLRR